MPEVSEKAVQAAGTVLERCEEERTRILLRARPGEPLQPIDRRIDARRALTAALPHLTLDEPLREAAQDVLDLRAPLPSKYAAGLYLPDNFEVRQKLDELAFALSQLEGEQ